MTAIAIVAEPGSMNGTAFRAVAGELRSTGTTPGEALDALASQLNAEESGTLIIVQSGRPDRHFSAEQQQRLAELMQRWRDARDEGKTLTAEERAELESLINVELQAATLRAADLLRQLGS
jgi:hypothetical protein